MNKYWKLIVSVFVVVFVVGFSTQCEAQYNNKGSRVFYEIGRQYGAKVKRQVENQISYGIMYKRIKNLIRDDSVNFDNGDTIECNYTTIDMNDTVELEKLAFQSDGDVAGLVEFYNNHTDSVTFYSWRLDNCTVTKVIKDKKRRHSTLTVSKTTLYTSEPFVDN